MMHSIMIGGCRRFEVGPMVECCRVEFSPVRLRLKASKVPLILKEKMECDFAMLWHSSA